MICFQFDRPTKPRGPLVLNYLNCAILSLHHASTDGGGGLLYGLLSTIIIVMAGPLFFVP